jgi:hypothetical protein
MLPIDSIDDAELRELATEATSFLVKHAWCELVTKGWIDRAWNDHVAIFYFQLKPRAGSRADPDVWVIVGDVPPAYVRTSACENGLKALRVYVEDMREWVEHVHLGLPTDNDVPVNVPAETKYANMLESRLGFIEREFLEDVQGNPET